MVATVSFPDNVNTFHLKKSVNIKVNIGTFEVNIQIVQRKAGKNGHMHN